MNGPDTTSRTLRLTCPGEGFGTGGQERHYLPSCSPIPNNPMGLPYMQAKEHQGRRPLVLPLDIIDNAATIRLLPTQTKTLDHGTIALFITLVEVVQQPAATTDQFEKTTAGVMIVDVCAQMLDQLIDTLCK